jgi:hypothetical protein
MTKRMFVTAVLLLGSCVTPAAEDHDLARVSVDALVRDPAAWDGKRVEVVGIASNRFENLGLYSNFADYCSVSTSRKAIYVRWDDVRGYRAGDEGRTLTVRGLFSNENSTERPTPHGMVSVTISTGAPGPGPLSDVQIVKRSPEPKKQCDVQTS